MTYEEAMEFIHGVEWQGSKPGLERTQELLRMMGNPEKGMKFVHIAGTNGKGSTASCTASILRKAGYKTGLYTSPYILRFNERVQINGEQISDEDLIKYVEYLSPLAHSMSDAPTEFELITSLAFKYFHDNNCDIVVLEVGMGGEFDATNVIEAPECAALTAIGLDHTDSLGSTVEAIAATKAGIIKPGCDVVLYGGDAGVEKVVEEICAERGTKLHKADFSRITVKGFDLEAAHFDLEPYKDIALPLIGTYQPKNATMAVTIAECLRDRGWAITDENIIDGLNNVYWPGRFEILRRDPIFVLDGAHNPHGMIATVDSLKMHFSEGGLVFLVGVMADKDVDNMMGLLADLAKCFITVGAPNPRAMDPHVLAQKLAELGKPVCTCSTIKEGVETAVREAGKDGAVCALGTLYFSGVVRTAVQELEN